MSKSPDAFRTISEVADWLGVQAHVLRFWESKFAQVKPVKRAGGRRYYRPADMLLLGGIRKLLHEDGLTIKGAQKLLREKGVAFVADQSPPLDDLTIAVLEESADTESTQAVPPAEALSAKASEAASETVESAGSATVPVEAPEAVTPGKAPAAAQERESAPEPREVIRVPLVKEAEAEAASETVEEPAQAESEPRKPAVDDTAVEAASATAEDQETKRTEALRSDDSPAQGQDLGPRQANPPDVASDPDKPETARKANTGAAGFTSRRVHPPPTASASENAQTSKAAGSADDESAPTAPEQASLPLIDRPGEPAPRKPEAAEAPERPADAHGDNGQPADRVTEATQTDAGPSAPLPKDTTGEDEGPFRVSPPAADAPVPKPRIVDVTLPDETTIAAAPRLLSALAGRPALTAETQAAVRPLLDRLAAHRDRLAAADADRPRG